VDGSLQILLPASGKRLETKGREPDLEALSGGERILLMDDDSIIRQAAGELLQHLGYEVELARDGAAAIQLYGKARESARPFDAVVLDLTVRGGMAGEEAFQILREIDPEIKAVVSSGYSDDPIISNFSEYGFHGVVAKPYEIEELGEALHKVLEGMGE